MKRAKIRAAAIRAIVRKALAVMGAVQRPYSLVNDAWNLHPQEEFDLEASLEEDPTLQDLIVERKEPRRAEVIVCLDTSLSMTGRKLAINAVALAVIALQLDPEDLAVVVFESDATVIKPLGVKMDIYQILEKFMEVPARGLTNIEAGLIEAEKEAASGKLPKKAVILMTDGRFTAGKNPEHIVPRLPRLHMVQTGNPWASTRFCRNLARQGRGQYVRVAQLEHLPKALYSLVHEIIR
ncbi:MAG: VWA domain-containing protein [Bacteriovoracia bacterium]